MKAMWTRLLKRTADKRSKSGQGHHTVHKVILQIQLPAGETSLASVRKRLGIRATQIDPLFGVKQLRPDGDQYAVRVDADVAQRVRGEDARPAPAAGARKDVRVTLVQ